MIENEDFSSSESFFEVFVKKGEKSEVVYEELIEAISDIKFNFTLITLLDEITQLGDLINPENYAVENYNRPFKDLYDKTIKIQSKICQNDD